MDLLIDIGITSGHAGEGSSTGRPEMKSSPILANNVPFACNERLVCLVGACLWQVRKLEYVRCYTITDTGHHPQQPCPSFGGFKSI